MRSFNIGLIGPITINKLRVLDRLTSENLGYILEDMEDNSIYKLEHYKVYRFSKDYNEISFSSIDTNLDAKKILKSLNKMSLEEAFKYINSYDFIANVNRIYIDLPINRNLKLNNIYGSIEVYETRGFLDGDIFKNLIVKNKPVVDNIAFSSLDFIGGSNRYVDCMKIDNYDRAPFIIKDISGLSGPESEIIKNAHRDISESIIRAVFEGYILI